MSYRDEVMQTQPQSRLCETLEIAARADAEIAALRADLAAACDIICDLGGEFREPDMDEARRRAKDAERYQVARRMNARQWADAHTLNLLTGKPLDQIIDELRPFYLPAKTIDAARGEAG